MAYGASIGGMGTIIGSPPNGIFVRFVQQTYGVDVSIVQWMKVGMPVVLLLMPLSLSSLLTKVLFREQIQKIAGGREWIRTELKNIGKPTRGEISVLIVFICAVVSLVLRLSDPFFHALRTVFVPSGWSAMP